MRPLHSTALSFRSGAPPHHPHYFHHNTRQSGLQWASSPGKIPGNIGNGPHCARTVRRHPHSFALEFQPFQQLYGRNFKGCMRELLCIMRLQTLQSLSFQDLSCHSQGKCSECCCHAFCSQFQAAHFTEAMLIASLGGEGGLCDVLFNAKYTAII